MRTLTAAQVALLNKPDRSDYLKVEVDSTGSGDFVNLCALDGKDYVKGASWGEDADGGAADATIELQREDFYRSLSPMRADSIYSGYIALNRLIRIYTATMPMGVAPQASDYELMFSGRIAKEDFGTKKPKLVLNCLDDAGDIQARFIEVQNDYGSALGDDIEDVMQDILDDHINTAPGVPFTLDVPASPGFAVTTYQQKKQVVLQALRNLADLLGYEVRMRYDSGSGTFKLTFYTPNRSAAVADFTFSPALYLDIVALSQDIDPIRNVVKVIYGTVIDEETDARSQTVVEVSDAASIALYGRRFMEICESSSSQIDSTPEATAMANAALSDLKLPNAEHSCESRYFWPAEVGDYYAYLANGIHYDTDFSGGAVSIRHSLANGGRGRTVIHVRGKPSTGVDRWLAKEARLGNAAGTNIIPPNAPASVLVTPGLGSLVIQFDTPADPEWDNSELYLSTSAITQPTFPTKPSSALLKQSGKVNKFVVDGLVPGQIYNASVLIINKNGRWSGSINFVMEATYLVGPYYENLAGQQDQLLRNNDLNVYTVGEGSMPDRWSVVTGTYAPGGADDTVYVQTVDHRTGDKALDLFYGGTANSPKVASAFSPYQGGDIVRAAIVARRDTAGGANGSPQVNVSILFADKDQVTISTSTVTVDLTTTYTRYLLPVVAAPATARYIRLLFAPLSTAVPATDFTLQVDKVSLIRGKGYADGVELSRNTTDAYTIVDYDVTDPLGVSESAGTFTFSASGQWRVRAEALIFDTPKFDGYQQIRVNAVQVVENVVEAVTDRAGDSTATIISDIVVSVDDGDTLDIRWHHDSAGDSLGSQGSVALTQITREETS